MSKLLQRLDQISEGTAQPLGFGAASRSKVAPMIIIAAIPAGNDELSSMSVERGADFLMITSGTQKKGGMPEKLKGFKPGVPWGAAPDSLTGEEVRKLTGINCDFVVFSPEKTEAAVMREENVCRVLRVSTSRTTNWLLL